MNATWKSIGTWGLAVLLAGGLGLLTVLQYRAVEHVMSTFSAEQSPWNDRLRFAAS
jgi:hypothetical protein